jgi:hypothetical protein
MTVPFMKGCGTQWNVYVPGRSNRRRQTFPGSITGEVQLPSSAVTVCGTGSVFVHSIVVPAVIVSRPGLNVN